jgi:hypothetical protein
VYFEHYCHKSDSVIFRLSGLADQRDSGKFAKTKGKRPRVGLPAVVENVTNVTGLDSIDMKLD